MTANMVPVCNITSSRVIGGEDGSSPSSFSTTTTCAELDTGKSSAKPCTIARMMTSVKDTISLYPDARVRLMVPHPFAPKVMKLSILTAALQELTPRARRDADPDLAIEEWLDFAREIGSPNIQLSAALHPSVSDVPAEAMLDPVANTLDLRQPFDRTRARRVNAAMRSSGIGLSDLGYFDNMLTAD